jgi:hypothetical protein
MDINVVIALLSILIGGVITWLVSRFYYVRASKDLAKEAEKLRALTELMLRGMESTDRVKYNHDPQGEPIGIIFEESGGVTSYPSGSGTDAVIRGPSEQG